MAAKLKNYEELKAALVEVIRYLDCGAFFEEGACYTEEDIKVILHETVDDAMDEYYKR